MKSLLILLLFSLPVFAQKTNEWKSVTLDQSKAEDVIKKFGKPSKDKKERVFVLDSNRLFDEGLRKSQFRIISYKEIEQAKNVRFGFNNDNVLVFIEFKPKEKLPVQSFLNVYQEINFQPIIQTVLGIKDTKFYVLNGEAETNYILSSVNVGIFGNISAGIEANRQTQSNKTLTGNIYIIQFISKSLENRKGQDVLK